MIAKANSQRLNLIGNGEKSEQEIANRMRLLSNQIVNDTFASQEVDSLSLPSRLLQVHSMQLMLFVSRSYVTLAVA